MTCCARKDLQGSHLHARSHSHSSSLDFKDDAVWRPWRCATACRNAISRRAWGARPGRAPLVTCTRKKEFANTADCTVNCTRYSGYSGSERFYQSTHACFCCAHMCDICTRDTNHWSSHNRCQATSSFPTRTSRSRCRARSSSRETRGGWPRLGGGTSFVPGAGNFLSFISQFFLALRGKFSKKIFGVREYGPGMRASRGRQKRRQNDGKTTAKRRRVTRHIVTLQLRRLSDGQRGGCCRHAMAARALVSEFG